MKIKLFAALIGIVLLSACGDSDLEPSLTVEDFEKTLTKRPADNQSLGQIDATSNVELISFSILNQTVENALSIDELTGEIFVDDPALFDINETDKLEAEVEVISENLVGLGQVTVNLRLPETTIDYFKEIALGFENGSSSEIVRKWKSTMKVYVDGNPDQQNISKLQRSIDDINELASDGFNVEIVASEGQSNCYIYFGSVQEYEALFPGTNIGSNFALFNVWFSNDAINQARIFIDLTRTTDSQQESLILEEITQVLGLGKDSPRFTSSIFYETPTNGGFATEYSEIDQELVRLLYHPDMVIGLNNIRVDPILREILKSSW